jgi:hypothetical protein
MNRKTGDLPVTKELGLMFRSLDQASKLAAMRSRIPAPALIVPRLSLAVLGYPVVFGVHRSPLIGPARPSALRTHRSSLITNH